ncbi:hypothetical protein OPQ81_010964 [Rhizoctonia solani]|nr:hypothetical protein OPQ81_010964 [Rhizoctonia solani]
MSELQPSPSQSKPNPLFLPEIIYMVLESVSLRRRDERNLALTCKLLFEYIMPRLWETVVGVEQLLGLIPGTAVTQQRLGKNKKVTVTISNRVLTESWERYWVYAPHVRSLYMHGFDSAFGDVVMTLRVDGLNILFAKRREFAGLPLPNLETLDIRQSDTAFDPVHQLALFTLLLSPSIRKLELRDYPRPIFGPDSNIPGLSLGPENLSPSALLLVKSLAKSLPVSHAVAIPPYYGCPTERMIASSSLGTPQRMP